MLENELRMLVASIEAALRAGNEEILAVLQARKHQLCALIAALDPVA